MHRCGVAFRSRLFRLRVAADVLPNNLLAFADDPGDLVHRHSFFYEGYGELGVPLELVCGNAAPVEGLAYNSRLAIDHSPDLDGGQLLGSVEMNYLLLLGLVDAAVAALGRHSGRGPQTLNSICRA
jgi:hypothetical protein